MNLFDFNLDNALKQVAPEERKKLFSELARLRSMLSAKSGVDPSLNGVAPTKIAPTSTAPLFPPAPDRLRRLVDNEPGTVPGPLNQQPQKDNPFLPREAMAELAESRRKANESLGALQLPTVTAPVEQRLRDSAQRMIDEMIESHLNTLRLELRFQLRQEAERLMPELLRGSPKGNMPPESAE